MKDITLFIQRELKPRFYANIPHIFPELSFKQKGNRWVSELHADGTQGTGKKEDRSVVTEREPTKVFDNTLQQAFDIITLYQQLHGLQVWEAVNQLCDIVGIAKPEYNEEAQARYLREEERRNKLEQSYHRQKQALFSEKGKATLAYLHRRGWKDAEIQAAGLGHISNEEANRIDAQRAVGISYQLSIPLKSGGTLYGFKFRAISTDYTGDKYVYMQGTEKRGNLFNLTGIQQTDGRIVVVEGELDALHAQVKGVKGIVATGGGKLTEDLLQAAVGRGIRLITLLFDRDARGAQFVRESIDIAHRHRMSVLVATFPEGEHLPDGTPIHDIDEYLQVHSAEELQALIDQAYTGSRWLLQDLIDSYKGKEFTDTEEVKLRNAVINLANHTPNEVEREQVLCLYAAAMNIDGAQVFTPDALRAVANQERAAQDALQQAQQTKQALQEATKMAEGGNVQGALQLMGKAATELRSIDTRAQFSKLLATPTEEAFMQRVGHKQEELPTAYEMAIPTGQKELFTLPSGAITFVCAPTSHGKSTFLQNLALQVAEQQGEGAVLYFSFEEDGDAVSLQFLNKYMNINLCRNSSTRVSNNLRALRHYYRTGEDTYISHNAKQLFNEKQAQFMTKLYTSGKLRVYYEDYDSDELIQAIRFVCSQIKVKAVFIDYIQLLYSRAYRRARMQRTEELKEICKDLKNLCVEKDLSIVVAAQLNREARSPLELHSQRIAEAADLERIANKILCIWNTAFRTQDKEKPRALKDLEKAFDFELGTGGKIYGTLTKNRGGAAGLQAVWTFDGNTGVIKEVAPSEDNQIVIRDF